MFKIGQIFKRGFIVGVAKFQTPLTHDTLTIDVNAVHNMISVLPIDDALEIN